MPRGAVAAAQPITPRKRKTGSSDAPTPTTRGKGKARGWVLSVHHTLYPESHHLLMRSQPTNAKPTSRSVPHTSIKQTSRPRSSNPLRAQRIYIIIRL